MNELRFTWDPKKARTNLEKHGVAFEEARSVFFDERAIEFYDDAHSEWEDRFVLLGLSAATPAPRLPLPSRSTRLNPNRFRAQGDTSRIHALQETVT